MYMYVCKIAHLQTFSMQEASSSHPFGWAGPEVVQTHSVLEEVGVKVLLKPPGVGYLGCPPCHLRQKGGGEKIMK